MVYSDNSTKSFPETRETNHSHQGTLTLILNPCALLLLVSFSFLFFLDAQSVDSMEHVSARVLSTTNNPITQVTQTLEQGNQLLAESDSKTATSESHNTVQIITFCFHCQFAYMFESLVICFNPW